MDDLTFLLEPDSPAIASEAALALHALDLPASGAFLTAAEALIERGVTVTKASLADALHEAE